MSILDHVHELIALAREGKFLEAIARFYAEIALREWSGGKIVRERFYYDPAQRDAARSSSS